MSIDTVSDVLSRITAIEQQVQQLQSGALLAAQTGVEGGSGSSAAGASTTDFASQLSQAQGTGSTTASASTAAADGSTSAGALASDNGASFSSLADSALGATGVSGGSGITSPSSASSLLTSGQQQFASTLSADTGLNPNVVSSWLLAEESGSAATSRQSAGNNDWLNIGYTDSGTYGATDSVWSDPVSAAHATAQWMQGQSSIDGYGTASSGIQSILSTVGQTPAAQIQAIQGSGWASGGYPSLPTLYTTVAAG